VQIIKREQFFYLRFKRANLKFSKISFNFTKVKTLKSFKKKITKNKKYLGLLLRKQLFIFEEKLHTRLGAHRRGARPLIFWKDEKFFYLLFLTTSRISTPIDLSLCPNKQKYCSAFRFQEIAWSFIPYNQKEPIFKLKDPALISKIYFCGHCENMEYLENLEVKE